MKFVVLLLVIAGVVVATLLLGWVYIRDTGSSTEIIIDKQEVKQDTDAAVEATKEATREAGEKLKQLGSDVERSLDESIQTEDESGDGRQPGVDAVKPVGDAAPTPEKEPATAK